MNISSLITIALIGSGVTAQAATLNYYYDFNGLNGALPSLNTNNLAGTAAGGALFTNPSGSSWINYTNGYEGLGYDSHTGGGQLTLGSSGNKLGLNTDTGFSLSLAVKDFSPGQNQSTATYGKLLTFTSSSNQTLLLQKDLENGATTNAGPWAAYAGSNIGNWANLTISRTSFSSLIITFQAGTLNIYLDGQKKISATGVAFSGDVDSLRLANNASVTMDDLQLYSGVLSSEEIAALAANPALPVPEPATAALSLAGLSLLGLRRRRI